MPVTPLQAATDVLDRADAVLALDEPPLDPITREDLRRMALSMGLAAIDTQLHWMVRGVNLRTRAPALDAIQVPFQSLIEMGNASVRNRRAGKVDRPEVRARNALNEAILRMTFQSAQQVEKAMTTVGIARPFAKLSTAIVPSEAPAAIKAHLNQLSHRRNLIVHEGDLRRLMRPQKITRQSITASFVREELDWIRRFVAAMDVVR